MIIDINNYNLANAATRDILFMYRDLVESYGGFGGTIDVGSFDAFSFLDAEVREAEGETLEIDVDLLRRGSSVAILCGIHDALCKDPASDFFRRIVNARDAKLFDFDPHLRAAIDAGIDREERVFFDRLPPVYDRFVKAYHRHLADS